MYYRLGKWIGTNWVFVILAWITLLVALRWFSPNWNDITLDGDFQYLPADCPSVVGQKVLDQAFPNEQSKSQVVVVVARERGEPADHDLYASYDIARRMHLLAGSAQFHNYQVLIASGVDGESLSREQQEKADDALRRAESEFDQAIEATLKLLEFVDEVAEQRGPDEPRIVSDADLAVAFHNRAEVAEIQGVADEVQKNRTVVRSFGKDLPWEPGTVYPQTAIEQPVTEVWTWQSELFGSQLIQLRDRKAYARLIVLHLSTEFLEYENVDLFSLVREEIGLVSQWLESFQDPDLRIGISGSASVGSDLLLASIESIRHTELFTLILVTLILLLVYRSPLLVGLPLITIGVSLGASLSFLAVLTQVHQLPGFSWWDFNVYNNTRIFVVVILFGAGTDYCLFLVSRYREELSKGQDCKEALARALGGVGDALLASALTTIIGVAMMFFSDFGKLRNSGPAIGICLALTLLACLTLAPAILAAFGRWMFWPARDFREPNSIADDAQSQADRINGINRNRFWYRAGGVVVARPGLILAVSFSLMAPFVYWGIRSTDHVTYDLLQSLETRRPSRAGTELLRRHFPIGESGPVVVLAEHPTLGFLNDEGEVDFEVLAEIDQLAEAMSGEPGVSLVRSLAAPKGERSPEGGGLASQSLRTLPAVRRLFVTEDPEMKHRVTRFEVVLQHDAFSVEATEIVNRLQTLLAELQQDPTSFWHTTQFSFAGTSAAISDLRRVTQADQARIKVLVVIAVYGVLLIILRRPLICLYMIATVLLSFFAALGITDGFFTWVEGDTYQGMDWRVPLFLFVILVAVGEDYNVYLASRVFEEQQRHGQKAGLRIALGKTGGIISSCGIIMAGTFLSMTSGTWGNLVPAGTPLLSDLLANDAGALRGIVQMGFALAVGVMLDTFLVRPVLLPAFIALSDRFSTNGTEERAG